MIPIGITNVMAVDSPFLEALTPEPDATDAVLGLSVPVEAGFAAF